jgi:hypothetical protein
VSYVLRVASSVGRFLFGWWWFRHTLGHLAGTYAVERQWTEEKQPYCLRITLRRKRLHVTFEGLPEGDWVEGDIEMNLETRTGRGTYQHRKSGKMLSGEWKVQVVASGEIVEDRTYNHHERFEPVGQPFVWKPKQQPQR